MDTDKGYDYDNVGWVHIFRQNRSLQDTEEIHKHMTRIKADKDYDKSGYIVMFYQVLAVSVCSTLNRQVSVSKVLLVV